MYGTTMQQVFTATVYHSQKVFLKPHYFQHQLIHWSRHTSLKKERFILIRGSRYNLSAFTNGVKFPK